jgi:hypothetical protein
MGSSGSMAQAAALVLDKKTSLELLIKCAEGYKITKD